MTADARDWNQDDRSRAQTRALLMAMSRKRDWFFLQSLPLEILIAVLTLGLRPLLTSANRFDRFRRLEWVQYAELARWFIARTDDPIASELERFACGAANRRSPQGVLQTLVMVAFFILVVPALQLRTFSAVLLTAAVPSSMNVMAIAYSAVLSIAWLLSLGALLRHRSETTVWLARCNDFLTTQDKRPVPLPSASVPWVALVAGFIIGVAGPTWAAFLIVVIAVQNRYIIATRAPRLAFIERMLEWMDRSGLPVEFDVEEISPDAAAALA